MWWCVEVIDGCCWVSMSLCMVNGIEKLLLIIMHYKNHSLLLDGSYTLQHQPPASIPPMLVCSCHVARMASPLDVDRLCPTARRALTWRRR